MERIAPLAKILAEANGIDWQHLHGSGDGGLIVEQDILNYLTRIMSGEEEPPATPVDAPPPEWTGTELPPGGGLLAPGMPSMDMLSSAGVDSDLAALVSQPAAVPTPGFGSGSAPGPALDEDALEFELEDEAELAPLVPNLTPDPAFDIVAPVPDLSFASGGTEPMHAGPMQAEPALPSFAQAPVAQEPATQAQAPEPTVAPAPAAAAPTGGVVGGLGNLLSRLYQKPASEEPAPAQPAPFQPAPVAQPEASLPDVAPVPTPIFAAESVAPEIEVAPVTPPDLSAPLMEPQAVDTAPQFAEPQSAEALAPEPSEPAAAASPVASPAEAAPSREAVWFGPYLRRDANVAPSAELCRQLSGALGQDVPLALLVARAAHRHAEVLGLSTVAVYRVGGEQARPVQLGSLRDALTALDGDFAGTPDLLVTDAGALDLDDLHLPHTLTLSVGRVQEGRAALTLNGPVDPAQGARFLASVAGTLEEPIILVI